MQVLRRLAAALPLGFLCACTLLVDLGGLSGGSDPAASGDGGPSPVLPNGEAGADAPTAADAASGTSPCAAAHAFCDDFDTGDPNLATRWSELKTTAGPLDLDTTLSRSAPRSLRMKLTPTMGNQDSHLGKFVAIRNGTARVEVDIFVPTPVGSYKEVDPIGVELSPTPTGYDFHGLYLIVRPDGTKLQYFASKKSANVDNEAPVSMTKDAWHHVVITFSYATMPPKGTISIDGDVGSVPMMGPTATKLDLQLGADYTDTTNLDWSLNFDNAVVDTP